MSTRRIVPLIAIVVLLAAEVAGQALQPDPNARLLGSLMTEIRTWDVVDGLQLSGEQMQALLPLAREVRAEQESLAAERERSWPAFEQGIRMLRTELLANNGVSDQAKAAVARAEAGWKQIEHRADESSPQRVHAVLRVLGPQQVQFLAGYRPGAGIGNASPQALARAEQFLTRARQLPPQQFEPAAQRQPGPGVPPRLREVRGAAPKIIAEARAMSDAEFQAHKGELAQRLLALMPRPQPARFQRPADDAPDMQAKVARLMLDPSVATVLQAKLGIAEPTAPELPAPMPEGLASMVTDVRVLNLVNSLYLSPQQMQAFSDTIARANAERDASRPQTQAPLGNLITAARDMRAELAAGSVTPATLARLRSTSAQAEDHRRQVEARMAPYVEQAKGALDENQVVLVSEFIPCLIPVRSLTNPERIGQAQDTAVAEQMLGRARTLPQGRLSVMLLHAHERLRSLLLRHHVPAADIEAKVADLAQVLTEARAMTDSEFEVKKAELAKRISPPDKPAVTGQALDRRIAEYLLNPNLLPILAERIAASR